MVKFSPKKKNKIIQENDNCQCDINEEINNTTQCNCQCSCIECPDEDPELDIEVDEDPEIEVVVETEDPELYTDVIYGPPGRDGTINGFNQLTLQGGENVEVVTEGEGKVGTATIYVDMSGKVTHLTELTIEYAQEHLGEIVQYIGETTEEYIEGYFYKASEVTEESKIEYTYDEGGISDVEVNKEAFENYVQPTEDIELTFIWSSEDNSWTLDGDLVDIALYGVSYTGEPIENNQLIITYKTEKTEYKWLQQNVQEATDISGKVDKTTEPNKIYGTDLEGNQTTYDKEDFGKVDDVRLNGVSVVGIKEEKIADIDLVAADSEYHNDAVASITNVQQALDNLMNFHYYKAPTGTFSVSNLGNTTREIGDTIVNPFTLSWNLTNRSLESVDTCYYTLPNGTRTNISVVPGTYDYTNDIHSNSNNQKFTFSFYYKDNHTVKPTTSSVDTYSASVTVTFMHRRFWGVTSTETLSYEQLLALSSELSTSRSQERDFNCSGGKYWWFAIPKELCSGIQFTDVGSGLPMTLPPECISERTITNRFGVQVTYNVYRGEFKQTASSVKIRIS